MEIQYAGFGNGRWEPRLPLLEDDSNTPIALVWIIVSMRVIRKGSRGSYVQSQPGRGSARVTLGGRSLGPIRSNGRLEWGTEGR